MATCYRHPDRETGLSCSECERPICVDCMTVAPVGIRCPEHAGGPKQKITPQRMTRAVTRPIVHGTAIVTRVLIALNVVVYLVELAGGSGVNGGSGWIFTHGALFGPLVHHGDWWRLITAAFLHYGPIHLGMNMLALWWLGSPVEMVLGHARYLAVYLISGLAGSAGALILSPNAVTVGASGAIFGMLGAGLILEYRATGSFGGNYLTLIIINLAFSLAVPNISIGGHVGGLIGGILSTLAILYVGKPYRRFDYVGIAALFGIAAVSIAIAYWKARGLA